jgi:hypothetical protein
MVNTDDQQAESVRLMPNVQRLLAGRGVTFTNSFVSYPLCCPSRSTWLTGQYAHNNGVRGNQPPSGGYSKLAPTMSNTLPVWLQRAGYRTAHIGKFLNGYGNTSPDTEVPPGWTEWYGALDDPDAFTGGTYTMYGYTLNENGAIVHYGSTPEVEDPATYQTDVYSARPKTHPPPGSQGQALLPLGRTLGSHTEAGSCNCAGNNPRAAPRDEGSLAGEPLPSRRATRGGRLRQAAGDQDLNPIGAAAGTRSPRGTGAARVAWSDRRHGRRADRRPKDKGELKNTVFIFTADNGFFNGEHRVRNGRCACTSPRSGCR